MVHPFDVEGGEVFFQDKDNNLGDQMMAYVSRTGGWRDTDVFKWKPLHGGLEDW